MKIYRYLFFFISIILSFIIPRTNNIVVFGSRNGKRFADNSRYLFFHMNKFSKKKIVWLTKSNKIKENLRKKNLQCFISHGIIGLYYGFRAKHHVYDYSEYDTSEFSSINSSKINLGHGIYLKKVKKYRATNIISLIYNYIVNKNNNYHTYPNKKYFNHISKYFPLKKYKLLLSNHPRNYIFSKKKIPNFYFTEDEIKIVNKIKKTKGKIIGYFPTWRQEGYDLFYDLKSKNQLIQLNALLKKKKSFIITKHHSNIFREDSFTSIDAERVDLLDKELNKLSNIINLDYHIDLNSILFYCDLLISDYSGAIADFLLSKKPMIIYTPDFNKYNLKPGLNFNYSNFKFGHRANNFDQCYKYLCLYFKNSQKFSNEYYKNREKIKEVFFKEKTSFEKILNQIN
jgi:CDP-glycerol glycerophosphotransferase (TagB/SpsB family)